MGGRSANARSILRKDFLNMENKALISNINSDSVSNVVAHLEAEKWYKLSYKVKGDFRLQFFCTDEDSGTRLFVINRCMLVTTGSYTYIFRPSQNAILEFEMRHEGEAYDIVLEEV